MRFRVFAALMGLLGVMLMTGAATAGVTDQVFNKEGVWGLDVDHGACAASMILPDGSTFLLRAADGEVNVALFARAKLKKGKAGRIETDAGGFDFRPGWSDGDVYTEDVIGAAGVATLRAARQVRIVIDGRPVMDAAVADTGFADAVDGVIACSKGQSGWWGKGVETAEAENDDAPLNKEGFWSISPDDKAALCTAVAKVDGRGAFALVAGNGRYSFGVGTLKSLTPGRQGRFQMDGYAFDFRPAYDGKDYLYPLDDLDDAAVAALRRAKVVRVSVDGEIAMQLTLTGSGHAQVLDDVAACARGRSGWWGEGAKPAP